VMRSDGHGRLLGTQERTGVDCIEMLRRQVRCHMLGLSATVGGQLGVGRTVDRFSSNGQGVAHQQQLHWSLANQA
jgi:hypothetical protein